jgi:hypothetical protein
MNNKWRRSESILDHHRALTHRPETELMYHDLQGSLLYYSIALWMNPSQQFLAKPRRGERRLVPMFIMLRFACSRPSSAWPRTGAEFGVAAVINSRQQYFSSSGVLIVSTTQGIITIRRISRQRRRHLCFFFHSLLTCRFGMTCR